uniref:G-type lectin S-receptor-like serine/threonine-protein kinase SD1-1 n=1 Tax=Erigeron canadensis TaxID=72917 RepID=UPI001CB8C7ED|nr:G-type lectin S-receptor-like serine/threonine-protein kinase SD1-1 [Erigeron canadensis]
MRNREWMQDLTIPMDYCDNYGVCGPYGSCSTATLPNCECLTGFEPKNPGELNQYSGGCRRVKALDCGLEEGFLKFSSMKLPDTENALFHSSMSLWECELACKGNCSCTAYANPNITTNGVGCLLWFGDLIDIREYPLNGQDLYVRLAASELLGFVASKRLNKKNRVLIVVISTSSAAALLFAVVYACKKKKKMPHMKVKETWYGLDKKNTSVQVEDVKELPFFSLHEILKATDDFSISNKIGEGGFGPVYKGILEDGREVAVKRLSETSQQGLDEFKNEVMYVAKLQHRNLVKLYGYCIRGNEMILIYEYMANKSLDTFLFDESKTSMLDWPCRFQIIHGMARAILYLHQDSRLQIIHRDLKAGNILLDADMSPKISDFGLARKFVGSDTFTKTKKVVGTYGYISPEYAVHGKFSIKSDVFSFGVLVLEIVSGKKNRGFSHQDHSDNLLGHAWRLYKENKSIELMSACLRDSFILSEVLRSIHVGLLCVQHHPEDRPTMLSVILMLISEGVLPEPKQPAFFTGESHREAPSVLSVDEYMITQVYAR